jgi:hypothetical protein
VWVLNIYVLGNADMYIRPAHRRTLVMIRHQKHVADIMRRKFLIGKRSFDSKLDEAERNRWYIGETPQ